MIGADMEQILAISCVAQGEIEPDAQRRSLLSALQHADEEITRLFPSPSPPRTVRRWTHPSGLMSISHWSNEGGFGERPAPIPPGVFIVGAHTATQSDLDVISQHSDELDQFIERLGGCLTILIGDASGLKVLNTVVPASPLYYGESAQFRVLSSRAHLVASICEGTPYKKNPLALHSLIQAGFVTGHATPFVGVKSIPLSTSIDMGPGHSEMSTSLPEQPDEDEGVGGITALAEALVNAVRTLKRGRQPIGLALSGGRDSRVIAAALHAAGVEFSTVTRGDPDDPDVQLAEQVAVRLGVPHEVVARDSAERGALVYVEDPWERAVRVADLTEGMTSAWDDVANRGPWEGGTILSGIGGEVLRGGYAYSLSEISREAAAKKISNLFDAPALLTAEAMTLAEAGASRWYDLLERGPAVLLDDLYLHERLGRWGVARKGAITRNRFFGPFLDNRVVRSALALNPRTRWTEWPMAELISLLAPQLTQIPLEGRPWRYLPDSTPVPRRHPRRPDWRQLQDRGLRALIQHVLLQPEEYGAADFFQLVDRAKLRHALQGNGIGPGKLWNMLTARAVLTTEEPGISVESKDLTVPILVAPDD